MDFALIWHQCWAARRTASMPRHRFYRRRRIQHCPAFNSFAEPGTRRHRRLSGGSLSGPFHGMERQVPRQRARLLAGKGPTSGHWRICRDASPPRATRSITASMRLGIGQFRGCSRWLRLPTPHAMKPNITRPTAKRTATGVTRGWRATSAWKAKRTIRPSCAPASLPEKRAMPATLLLCCRKAHTDTLRRRQISKTQLQQQQCIVQRRTATPVGSVGCGGS